MNNLKYFLKKGIVNTLKKAFYYAVINFFTTNLLRKFITHLGTLRVIHG